jgi:hypothetical protein
MNNAYLIYQKNNAEIEREIALVGKSNAEREKVLAIENAKAEALRKNTALTDDQLRSLEQSLDRLDQVRQAQARADVYGSHRHMIDQERGLVGLTREEQEKVLLIEQARSEALSRNTTLTEEQIRTLEREIDRLHEAQKLAEVGDEIGYGFARGFQEASKHARNLGDVLDYLGDAALNVLDRVMELTIWEPMAQSISKGFTGMMPKPRASGGGVYPGEWYMAGELGPELVRFDRPGTVYPHHQTAAQTGTAAPSVSIQVNNTSQAQVDVAKPDIRFDGQQLLVGMVIKDRRNYGPMSRGQRRS